MTFRLDIANRAGLFRHYAAWYEDDNCNDNTHMSIAFSIGYLTSSLERVHSLKHDCLEQYNYLKEGLEHDNNEVIFQSPSLFELFSELNALLSQMRIFQNLLMTALSKHYKESFPASMHDFVKKERKSIDSELYKLIKSYWCSNGLKLKQYRDLCQHYDHLFTSARIVRKGNVDALEVRLPDNPEITSSKKFKFNDKVDCISFVEKSFTALHEFVNDVSKYLGYHNDRDFDLTLPILNQGEAAITVSFDPKNNFLIGNKVNFVTDVPDFSRSVYKVDLKKYSFVKLPVFFHSKHSFVKIIEATSYKSDN